MIAILLPVRHNVPRECCEHALASLEVYDPRDGATFRVCGACAPQRLVPDQRHG